MEADDPLSRNPTTWFRGCCARTASGHVAEVAIPSMKHVVALPSPRLRTTPIAFRLQQEFATDGTGFCDYFAQQQL
jgi:hypothetical protein